MLNIQRAAIDSEEGKRVLLSLVSVQYTVKWICGLSIRYQRLLESNLDLEIRSIGFLNSTERSRQSYLGLPQSPDTGIFNLRVYITGSKVEGLQFSCSSGIQFG